jgi:VWFA-related protein
MKFTRYLSRILLAGLLALMALGSAAAQDEGGGPQVAVVDVDNAAFPLLTLKLSVVDANGQPVRGLTPGALMVVEDGQPAEVTGVKDIAEQELGIGVVLVIDVSGSMAGAPIEAARAAATSFIDGLGANDQVAILTFDREVKYLLPFSANKADAATIIRNLTQTPGGATALYDAAKQGVRTAATSTLSRRMVILLSDGKEYVTGGQTTSLSGRDEAYKEAEAKGVTVHTLGLGNQIDEAYLHQLAGLTGGVYLAAPTPAELQAQWQTVAALMRQLVEVQVRSSLRGENESHDLTVSVTVGKQTVEAKQRFFSKAVAPVVALPGLPQTPLAAVTTVTARVEAAEVARVAFSVDGQPLSEDQGAPWEATLDPLKFAPGAHTLTIQATDAGGLTGSADVKFEVAPLPPAIELAVTEGQLLDQPLSVTPDIEVQGQIQSVTLEVDGQTETLSAAPYRFVLDPLKLKGGAHKLTLTVTDAQEQTTTKEVGFTVPNAPPTAGAGPILVVTTPGGSAEGGFSPVLVGAIAFAVVVLAGMVGFVLLRRAPARAAKVRGPALRVVSGIEKGQVFPITATPQIIGRISSAPIHLSDPSGALRVSREHARVWLEEGAAWIEDAGSRHGTYADEHKLVARFRLVTGTRIKIGEVELAAEGITTSAEDLRATSFTPLAKSAAADAASRETLQSAEAEDRQTRIKPTEAATDEANRATVVADAEAERQTRFKPTEAAPEAAPEAGDEALRATVLANAEAERQTRFKPTEAAPEAAPEAGDEALRATVLADAEAERQTRLKPAAPTSEPEADAFRATRLAKGRLANAGPGEPPNADGEARQTKIKND